MSVAKKNRKNRIIGDKMTPFQPKGKYGNLFVDTTDMVFSKMETTTRKIRGVDDKMSPTELVQNLHRLNK